MSNAAAREELRSRVNGTRHASACTARSVLTTARAARNSANRPTTRLMILVLSVWRCASAIALPMSPVSPAARAASWPDSFCRLGG